MWILALHSTAQKRTVREFSRHYPTVRRSGSWRTNSRSVQNYTELHMTLVYRREPHDTALYTNS